LDTLLNFFTQAREVKVTYKKGNNPAITKTGSCNSLEMKTEGTRRFLHYMLFTVNGNTRYIVPDDLLQIVAGSTPEVILFRSPGYEPSNE
jgi:hypothetical protein